MHFPQMDSLWGNPLFRWDEMKKDGYSMVDETDRSNVKDHMILYGSIISVDLIPIMRFLATDDTARNGEWREGPGMDLFHCIGEEA